MSVKDELRGLVDQLSDQGAAEAVRYLRWLMREEALRATLDAAPLDDEPETDEERAAVAEGKADLEAGRVVPAAEVYRRFGL
jgi:predicted transcriptional regulator